MKDDKQYEKILEETERTYDNLEFVCNKHFIPRETYINYRRLFSIHKLKRLIFRNNATAPDIDFYNQWKVRINKQYYDFADFAHPRWQLYKITGRLLGDLFETATAFELPPSMPSFFGDGGDETVQHASTAIWLCVNVAPFVNEVAFRVNQKESGSIDLVKTIADVYEILAVECKFLGNEQVLNAISRLLVSIGIGILPANTDWSNQLMELVELQLESTSGSGYERPIIRWALDIETNNEYLSLEVRNTSFKKMVSENQSNLENWNLNNWAYMLLRLGLYKATTPMAQLAVETKPWAGAYDTLGWSLFYEKKYAEAEYNAKKALDGLTVGTDNWLEVQYHRTEIAFWSNRFGDLYNIISEMQSANSLNYWTQKATKLKALIPSKQISRQKNKFEYDIAISFSGQDRKYADELARMLSEKGLNIFYDEFQRSRLWGTDLYEQLSDVYRNQARFCIILVSNSYAKSRWTTLERRAAQARALVENEPYILPILLDNTEIPGILPTVGYVSWHKDGIDLIIKLIIEKLSNSE